MATAFEQKTLQKPGFIQRLMKKHPSENFLIEVNNLFSSKPITAISRDEIEQLVSKYGGRLSSDTINGLYNLYSDYLIFCLSDKVISAEEIAELKHLKEILALNDTEVKTIHNSITGKVYQMSIREAVDNGEITVEEQNFLTSLQQNLLLPDELVQELAKEVKGNFVNDYLKNAVTDERLSPKEEEQLELICKNLNVDLTYSEATRAQLSKYKLYWTIENGELPAIDVPISLGKQEECYFQTHADWYEQRTVTQRINYRGTTASIRIMKGVRYRVGSIKPQQITSEEYKLIDRGTLYLTNKRLIFTGRLKNSTINLTKILSFTPYADGVEISKETGRPPLLKLSSNNELFQLILSRLLNG